MRPLFLVLISSLLSIASLVSLDSTARANPAAPARQVFALVVTSNRGASGARPDLHYADDDGVKYLELFRMLAPEANVILHTELDRDTARLSPWASSIARPPTKAAIGASIAELSGRIGAITRAGGAADFYFVFAGHGDVEGGVGFLELRDARFTSRDVESMLRSVSATRSHVILDSCNSFFVINARKPGGKQVATTADQALSLGERLPNVGVFVSTSSEAEVFEWSELQAGIFSHAVRSGLTGAADANGDGDVSYEELRAFVSVASARIRNPQYRPKVFARGPAANARASLVSLAGARGTALRIAGPQIRLTLRDADDVPLVDLHKEQGAALAVHLPARWATHAAAEEHAASEEAPVVKRFALEAPHDEPIALADLSPAPVTGEARGASDVFRMLFAAPFGPRAMKGALEEVHREDAEAVYGVSDDSVERMRILLAQSASNAHGRRLTTGIAYVTFGAGIIADGVWLATKHDTATKAEPYVFMGLGGLLGVVGTINLADRSSAEVAYDDYLKAIQAPDPSRRAQALANAEGNLFVLRERSRSRRTKLRWLGVGLAGFAATALVLSELTDPSPKEIYCPAGSPNTSCPPTTPAQAEDSKRAVRIGASIWFAGALVLTVSSFFPDPIEQLADVWESDPGRVRPIAARWRPNVAIAPTTGGASLHLGWTF